MLLVSRKALVCSFAITTRNLIVKYMIPICPFNRDAFLHAEVARLVGRWQVGVAFETGTFRGHTTIALSLLCELTYTAEINEESYDRAAELFELAYERGDIIADLGTSPEIIRASIPEITGLRVLFYLDAHWEDYWPLLDELKVIAELSAPPPVIVIHDFKVPDRPDLGFDSYGDQDLDYDYIRQSLTQIYGENGYDFHFNRVAIGAHRGVIFIEPKY